MLVIFLVVWLAKSKDLTCHLSQCPDIRKGNHKCDFGCMTSYCNFDTSLSIDGKVNKEFSDCYKSCVNLDGCDPKNLGNGQCDNSCNTESCGFDWGDCTCAPGCLDSMLGDGICDEACDNWDCDLDNHDCGHCADGCFPIMLGNGICDPECNNEDCLYDYKDCQCAENCLLIDYGTCKPECMVASCNYDRLTQYPNNWCQNPSLSIFSSYQQIIRNDFWYITHLEDCYEASNFECTFEKLLNFTNCYEECNILECNYSNGICTWQLGDICNRFYIKNSYLYCFSCLDVFDMFPAALVNNSCFSWRSSGIYTTPTIFPDNTKVVVPLADTSSVKIPHIYFVCPDLNPVSGNGEGTYFSPFISLDYAVNNIAYKYSIVYLLECDQYYLTAANVWYTNNVIIKDEYTFAGKHVKFTPLNNDSKIIIKSGIEEVTVAHYHSFSFIFLNAKYIEIVNLIFDWKLRSSICKDEIYCDYCPFVVRNNELKLYYNDRGGIIHDFLDSSYCKADLETNFTLIQSSNLLLKNVSFINFRADFNTIILVENDSNVTFQDVTFDNIKMNEFYESWIVKWDGNRYGNLKFENGVVSRLNNGYELVDRINAKGFLNASEINSIVFRNVEFRNNVVMGQSLTNFTFASLMYLNLFQSFWVDNCTFLYNYCDLGIINIQQQKNSFLMEIDDYSDVSYSKLSNIHIFNSKFISNYGKIAGALYALYNFESQNILIENSSFSLNGIENGELIHIESTYADTNYELDRKINVTLPDGDIIEGIYSAKWLKFYNLDFIENYSGKNGMVGIIKMVNIEWKNILMSSNGLILSEPMNANSILLKYYIENPAMYAKLNITYPVDLHCQSLSMISDSINFRIEKINANNNFCKYSSPSIVISNTTNSKILSASFYENKGLGSYGTCLALFGDSDYKILYSEFYSNTNFHSEGGIISSLSSLSIQNCTFSNNIGCLHFQGQNLSIFSSLFDSNSSPQSNGGAISLSISQDILFNQILLIKNTTFVNNSCSSNGGVIYIDKTISFNLSLELTIEDTIFYSNQAIDGSCIYIDNSATLTRNSSISNCTFQENKANFSGTISAAYLYGILILDNCTFLKNSGIYSSILQIAIGETELENLSRIILNSCIFQFNSGNITISLDNISINSTLEANFCLFEYNIGVVFSLDNDYAILKNSKIQHNLGGALNLKNSAIFISENMDYLNCSSNTNAGVGRISLRSQFICFSCAFIYNNAALSGGVIYADSDSKFYIADSIFTKNSCGNKGSIVFMASSLVNSSIHNCEIYENHAYDGTIYILSSSISIFSSKTHNNTSDGKNPSFCFDDSTGIIENVTFSNQIGNEGCFIYMSTSFVTINNSMIYKGFSSSSGIAIHATSSNVKIYSSIFFELFSNNTGGAIYLYEDSSISIKDSQFFNSDSSIDSYSSTIFIENTLFKNHTYTAIYASKIDRLEILSSKFIDGYGNNGGALYCAQCNIILIKSSSFSNNLAAENGGAIYVTNEADHNETAKITIVSSDFQNNTARNGGAIWTNNINFEISSSISSENKANSLQVEDINEIVDGIGGAISISCLESNIICEFNFSLNYFINNTATYNGGAINWDDSKPNFENNIFENNSAQYGPDVASFPIAIVFLNNINRNLNSQTFSEDKNNLILNNIASGQKNNPPLEFALVDDLYQIVSTDFASQAEMQAMNEDTIISGSSMVNAKNGIYYFNDYVISAKPGSSAYINIISSGIDTNKMNTLNNTLQMSSSFLINANLRLCEIGEATVGLNCEICSEFYYNIDANESKCLECPSSAICYGNFTMIPKPGYWRDNKLTDKFWKCLYSPVCLGSPNISNLSLTGVCKKGYENNLCHSCASGYSRLYKNECEVCPDLISNIFRWIGISAFLLFIVIIILKITRDSLCKPNSLSTIYLKIFWNYLQIMIIIIATYNLNWSYSVTKFYFIQTSLDYIGGQLFSFDCFLQLSHSKSKIYYNKILITSLTPFGVWFLCLASWIFIYKIKRKQISEIKDDYISSCIVLLFIIHPSIIDIMFSAFSCKEINSGEFWLNIDLGIKCWNHDHLFYAFLLALPTIIIWVILMPLLCLIHLIKNKKRFEEVWMKKRYSFLYKGYNSKHYYWEFVILFYKVILIACSAFLSNISVNIQALTAALMLVLFLYLHTRNEPFSKSFMNKAETLSRLVTLITILCGLCFLTNDLETAATYLLITLLIVVNILFIAFILINFLLQFAIINKLIMVIRRIIFQKDKNSGIGVTPIDENEQDQRQNANFSIASNENLVRLSTLNKIATIEK